MSSSRAKDGKFISSKKKASGNIRLAKMNASKKFQPSTSTPLVPEPPSLPTVPSVNKKTKIGWDDGRRIVELGVLAEGLAGGDGEGCNAMLDLRNCSEETRNGIE